MRTLQLGEIEEMLRCGLPSLVPVTLCTHLSCVQWISFTSNEENNCLILYNILRIDQYRALVPIKALLLS
jgi:hypothetical protein